MKLYFAPLEGITTHIYRNTHKEMFGGCDAYYAPFIVPSDNEKVTKKGLKDVLPENNINLNLKLQVLINHAPSFMKFVSKIKAVDYDEININLGCPSGTVVKKGRGAGFLRDTYALDRFLYEIFSESDIKISVKTRIGYSSGDEMEELMKIYNKYPMSLLIIHPRTREDFYNGEPDIDVFSKAYEVSENRVCYNGNIFSVDDYKRISAQFPGLEGIMIGRGAVMNPAIFREINGGARLTTEELIEFSKRLVENYNNVLKCETYTLNKLKEIWTYILLNYPNEKKIIKAIKKAHKLTDFMNSICSLPKL